MSKLFLIAVSLLACVLSEPTPAGSYCGSYTDEIQVSVTILSPQYIRLNGSAFGTTVGCAMESASYVMASHSVSLPLINTPTDCLGSILRSYSFDPADLSIVYDPMSNAIAVAAGAISFSLVKCNPQNYWSEINSYKVSQTNKAVSAHYGVHADPSGAYCGTYASIAVVRATVLSLKSFDLVATILGVAEKCDKEDAAYNPTTHAVTFPNVNAPSDCLGSTLRGLSVDPASITVMYDVTKDTLEVTDQSVGVSFSLTKPLCTTLEKELSLIQKKPVLENLLKADPIEADPVVPSGMYCGTYLEIVTIKATVLSLKAVKLVGIILGFTHNCDSEDVGYNNDTHIVTFPDVLAPADCLGKLLLSYGLSPASLSGKYDPDKNTLAILVESITLTLARCTSEQLMEDYSSLPKMDDFHQARIAKLLRSN
jgi:hypothetical protein